MRAFRFKKHKYDHLTDKRISEGELAQWEDLAVKEMATIFSVNFVGGIKPSDRLNKLNKKQANMSFIPGSSECNA